MSCLRSPSISNVVQPPFLIFPGWYFGGGQVAVTFADPRFLLDEDLLQDAALDLKGDCGVVLLDQGAVRLRADAGLLLGVTRDYVSDVPVPFVIVPSIGADLELRGEWQIGDGLLLELALGGTAIFADFGIVEFTPQLGLGAGWRF